MRTTTALSMICVMTLSLAAAGCGGKKVDNSLIGQDLPLVVSGGEPGVYVSKTRGDIKSYHRVVIEPVVLLPYDQTCDLELAKRLTEQYRRELVSRLANHFEVVDHGGANVLRVRAAIINSKTCPLYDLSAASMEVVVTDSVTNELKLALADTTSHFQEGGRSLFSDWENALGSLQAWASLVRRRVAAMKDE